MGPYKKPGSETTPPAPNPNQPKANKHPVERPIASLLQAYMFALGFLYDLNVHRKFSLAKRQVSQHLQAAGFANQIAQHIRPSKSGDYVARARAHCSEILPAANRLQRDARLLLKEQQIDADLLYAWLQREFAFCSEEDERTEHIQVARTCLDRIKSEATSHPDPSFGIQFSWEEIFLKALDEGSAQEVKSTTTNLMRNIVVIVHTNEHISYERAKYIHHQSIINAKRIGIHIESDWKKPPVPTRKR